jgi:two-component system, cell cycle sensor histidine kinase and response regulator CckA
VKFKYRVAALAAAGVLVLGHIVLLLLRYGTATASLWGDLLGVAGCVLATITSWLAARSAGPFGKRVWRLVALSGVLATVGQALYTYYYDFHVAPLDTIWPSDVLVFFWAVPAMMALFLSPLDPNSGFRWLRICDFVQVCSLVLAVELSTIYVPSRWQAAWHAIASRALGTGMIFFGVLALSFVMRGLLSRFRPARKLFLRLSLFFFVFAITTNITLSAMTSEQYQQGMWPDLLWTVSYCLLAVVAATWNDPEEHLEKIGPPARSVQLLAQFSPLLIPAVVFPLALGIAQEQFLWAVALVTVSFAAAGGRMFVVQNQLLISSHEFEKSLALLQGITEGTTDAIFVKDLQGRYLMMNSAGAHFLGRKVEEIIGKNDLELFNPESGRQIMEGDRQVLQSGEMQTYEEAGVAGGVARIYLSNKGPFRDSNGEVVGLLGICRDITDRKRAEVEILKSEQKLKIHVEHTPLAVIEWDTEHRVASWNPAAERIFGYPRAEAMGRHASFFVPPQFREHVDRVGKYLLTGKGGSRSTNENITKDGRIISCEWYNTPLVGESGVVLGVASLVQDVTERVALEERLRQSEKMEAIGRLAGGVAHDFNNLLTVILGYTQIMTDGVPGGSRLANATAQIKSAADRAAGITRQLLAFSRKQVRSPQLIDLNNVMMNLDTMLRRLIGEDIEVLSVPGSQLGTVNADPGQVEQILMNLALNARDAMPNGGKLTLETANVELDDAYAHEHRPVEPGRYVMMAVSDTGVGMSPETLARIFEPFYTTKELGKGTGLGLATVYGIVKASGGYVWVYSEPGQGTTFKIYLPRVDQPAQAVLPEKAVASVQRGTETILLVEDDPQLIQLSSSVLAHCGYKVLAAANPDEALTLCRANRGDIRLLVTDVVMPKMNGRQLAEEVTKICPHVRMLYVSGYTSNAIVHYGVLDAGLWFLPKPFSLSALVAKVREVLDAPGNGRDTRTSG